MINSTVGKKHLHIVVGVQNVGVQNFEPLPKPLRCMVTGAKNGKYPSIGTVINIENTCT
ncbi:hypothetical protein MgSA37_04296 [Mucilaginibacter gotjawali]|uniref:Uncharacterized protein n=2 Tax=Mucilaginibacter gotjawali TaxID=1550579 RepID=A0A0X8X5Q0_9SPHI|nr:hypothetical protein [Mucilaginibacter gotjawali]BAU56099.1 hypothetical protein MgSA37_04296 [Mucilaginibacter gotjawali]